MLIYYDDFNTTRPSSKVTRIVWIFDLFFRIINYWNDVNRKMVDDFFEFVPVYDHLYL